MHFEILIEDQSGEEALNILLPKILGTGEENSFRIHSYKGIGHIPKNLKVKDAKTASLLNNLSGLINGYGKSLQYTDYALFIICDLDDKDLQIFKSELNTFAMKCDTKPKIIEFCFAIEEGESWLLGDISAIKHAYPKAKDNILNEYKNDSICGTWEKLADAIYKGGSKTLSKKGFQEIGKAKFEWAQKICPHMNINENLSPSFNYFKNKLYSYMKTS